MPIEFNSGDSDTVMPSVDKSDGNEDICDGLVIPSYIVDEAAVLSRHDHSCPLLGFEVIPAREQSFLRYNGPPAELHMPLDSGLIFLLLLVPFSFLT